MTVIRIYYMKNGTMFSVLMAHCPGSSRMNDGCDLLVASFTLRSGLGIMNVALLTK